MEPNEEEKHIHQPHQRGRGGNRGRGRGGHKEHHDRPQTFNKQDRPHQERTHERHYNKKGGPGDAPKDSWYYKFHFGPWPKVDKVEVTLDTVVPPMPPKEERKQEPSKETYAATMTKLDEEIDKLREQIQAINKEKQDKIKVHKDVNTKEETKKHGKETKLTWKEALALKNKHLDKLKQRYNEINNTKKQLSSIQEEIQHIEKNINQKYRTEERVNERMKEIEDKMHTTTIKPAQEKEFIKELEFLKKSIDFV